MLKKALFIACTLFFFSCNNSKPEKPVEKPVAADPMLRHCTVATAIKAEELGSVKFDNPDTVRMLIISQESQQNSPGMEASKVIRPLMLNDQICIFKNVMEVSFPLSINYVPNELKCLPLLTTINLNLWGNEDLKSLGSSLSSLSQLKVVRVQNTNNEERVQQLKKHLRKDLLFFR